MCNGDSKMFCFFVAQWTSSAVVSSFITITLAISKGIASW